ncbi:Listeria/Bacterioides repeat-containing protein [Lachnospiraceae bacterium]|nr:Listeria/Bacterioides repeat-containing protein [Lachnospiraceae bacterium]
MNINIHADAGVFPEGSYFTADKITGGDADRVEDAVEDASGKVVTDSVAFDLTVYHDGHAVQPDKSKGHTYVTFSNLDLDDGESIEVYHVNDNLNSAKEVSSSQNGGDEVEFETNHFTIFVAAATRGSADTVARAHLTIVDQNGNAVKGALVTLKQGDTSVSGETGSNGSVELVYDTSAGDITSIVISKSGYQTLETGASDSVITLTAYKDTIHFDSNPPHHMSASGSMDDQEIFVGSEDNLTKNAFKVEGYDFVGWDTKREGNGTRYSDEASYISAATDEDRNITLFAQWTKANSSLKIKGSLNSGHAQELKHLGSVKVKIGGEVQRDGVCSWSELARGTTYEISNITPLDGFEYGNPEQSVISGEIVGDTEIVIPFVSKKYNVSYDLKGGRFKNGVNAPTEHIYKVKTVLPKAGDVIREGYKFEGWVDASNNNPISSISEDFKGDVSVAAKWSQKTYRLKIEKQAHIVSYSVSLSGDKIDPPVQTHDFHYGDVITISASAAPGYDPGTIRYNDNESGVFTFTDEDIHVRITVDKAEACVLTVNDGDGIAKHTVYVDGVESTGEYTSGKKVKIVAEVKSGYDPTKIKYDPQQEFRLKKGENVVNISAEPLKYKITYDLSGNKAVNGAGNPTEFTVNDTITLNDPKNPGFVFRAWKELGTNGNQPIRVIEAGAYTSDITLTALWDPDTAKGSDATAYLVAPWANIMGSGYEDDDDRQQGTDGHPTDQFISVGVVKSGRVDKYVTSNFDQFVASNHSDFDTHVFAGTMRSPVDEDKNGYSIKVSGNKITVISTKVTYTADLNAINWYEAKKEPSDLNTVGYHVDGWVKWNKEDTGYVVKFDTKGGEPIPENQTVSYNGKVQRPEDPKKSGSRFDGWFTTDGGTELYNFDTPVTAGMTLYAGWTSEYKLKFDVHDVTTDTFFGEESPVKYDLTLEDAEGVKEHVTVSSDGIPVIADTKYSFSAITVDDQYEYVGYRVGNGDTNTNPVTAITGTITGNTEIVVDVKLREYTVSFNAMGGSPEPVDQSVRRGDKAKKPETDPKKAGHVFNGWYTEEAAQNEYDFNTPVSADMILYAGYEKDMTISTNATIHIRIPSESIKPKPVEKTSKFPEECNGYPIANYLKVGKANVTSYIAGTYSSYNKSDLADHVKNAKPYKEPKANGIIDIRESGRLVCWILKIDGKYYVDVVENGELWRADMSTFEYYVIKKPKGDSNYHIDAEADWVKVENGLTPLTISGNSGEVTYDGQEHKVEGYSPTQIQVGSGTNQITGITAIAKGTDVGTYDTVFTGKPSIKGGYGVNIAERYKITYVPGKLVINPRMFTVSFNTLGGIPVPKPQTVSEGSVAVKPEISPSMNGFVFDKWCSDPECRNEYNFSTGVTGDMILYAGYKQDESPSGVLANTFVKVPTEGQAANAPEDNGQKYVDNPDGANIWVGTAEISKFLAENREELTGDDVNKHISNFQWREAGRYEYNGVTYWLKTNGEVVNAETVVDGKTWVARLNTVEWRSTENGVVSDIPVIHVIGNVEWRALSSETRTIILSANSLDVDYTGEMLFVEGFEKTAFDIDGETYTVSGVSARAEGIEASIYETVITYGSDGVVVTDGSGTDVTEQFTVDVIKGYLNIRAASPDGKVHVSGNPINVEYDGKYWKVDSVSVDGISGNYTVVYYVVSGNNSTNGRVNASIDEADIDDEGDGYSYEDLPSYTDVTKLDIVAVVKSDNYKDIPPYHIPFEITPRIAKAGSVGAKKVYDGKPLTTTNNVTIDRLVEGQTPEITMTGSQLHAGSSKNTFTVASSSTFKSTNYALSYEYGSLEIEQAPVGIKAKSLTKNRGDADPAFEAEVVGNIYNNEVTWSLTREAGEAVGVYAINVAYNGTPDYNVTTTPGTLTIKRRGGGGGGNDPVITPTGTPGAPVAAPGGTILPFTAATAPIGGAIGAIAGPGGTLIPAAGAVPALGDIEGEVLGIRSEPAAPEEGEEPAEEDHDLISDVLGVREEACWIHWLILLLTIAYTLYNAIRIAARRKLIKELSEDNDEQQDAQNNG